MSLFDSIFPHRFIYVWVQYSISTLQPEQLTKVCSKHIGDVMYHGNRSALSSSVFEFLSKKSKTLLKDVITCKWTANIFVGFYVHSFSSFF